MNHILSGFFGGVPADQQGQDASSIASSGSALPVLPTGAQSESPSGHGFEDLLQGRSVLDVGEEAVTEAPLPKNSQEEKAKTGAVSKAETVNDEGENAVFVPKGAPVHVTRLNQPLSYASLPQGGRVQIPEESGSGLPEDQSLKDTKPVPVVTHCEGAQVDVTRPSQPLLHAPLPQEEGSHFPEGGESSEDQSLKDTKPVPVVTHREGAQVDVKRPSQPLLHAPLLQKEGFHFPEGGESSETQSLPYTKSAPVTAAGEGAQVDVAEIGDVVVGSTSATNDDLPGGSVPLNVNASKGNNASPSEVFVDASSPPHGQTPVDAVSPVREASQEKEVPAAKGRLLEFMRDVLGDGDIGDDEPPVLGDADFEEGHYVLGNAVSRENYSVEENFSNIDSGALNEAGKHPESSRSMRSVEEVPFHAKELSLSEDQGNAVFPPEGEDSLEKSETWVRDTPVVGLKEDLGVAERLDSPIPGNVHRYAEKSQPEAGPSPYEGRDEQTPVIETSESSSMQRREPEVLAEEAVLGFDVAADLHSRATEILPLAGTMRPDSENYSEDAVVTPLVSRHADALHVDDLEPLPLKERPVEVSSGDIIVESPDLFSDSPRGLSLNAGIAGETFVATEQASQVVQPRIYGQVRSNEREPLVFVESKPLLTRALSLEGGVVLANQDSELPVMHNALPPEQETETVSVPKGAHIRQDTVSDSGTDGIVQEKHRLDASYLEQNRGGVTSREPVNTEFVDREVPVRPQVSVPLQEGDANPVAESSFRAQEVSTTASKPQGAPEGDDVVHENRGEGVSLRSEDVLLPSSDEPSESMPRSSGLVMPEVEAGLSEEISEERVDAEVAFTRPLPQGSQVNDAFSVRGQSVAPKADALVSLQPVNTQAEEEAVPFVKPASVASASDSEPFPVKEENDVLPLVDAGKTAAALPQEQRSVLNTSHAAKDSVQSMPDKPSVGGVIPSEMPQDYSKGADYKQNMDVLSKAGMPVAQQEPRMQSKLQRSSEGPKGLTQAFGVNPPADPRIEHIRREIDTVPFVNVPSKDSIEASSSEEGASNGLPAQDSARDIIATPHRSQNHVAPQPMEAFASKTRTDTLPSVPDLNPKLLRQLEQFQRSQRPWAKVSLPMNEGEDLMLRMKVSSGRVQIRFGTQSLPLREGLEHGWSELVTHAASRGILLDAPEFEARLKSRVPALDGALLEGSSEDDDKNLRLSKKRGSTPKQSIEPHESLDNYSGVLKWA